MEEENVLLGGNGMGESKEDKRMRAKWESLSGAEKSEFKKNYAKWIKWYVQNVK